MEHFSKTLPPRHEPSIQYILSEPLNALSSENQLYFSPAHHRAHHRLKNKLSPKIYWHRGCWLASSSPSCKAPFFSEAFFS